MAEVVNLLAENLTQLLKENIQLISGLKDDVEKLLDDLGDFKAFLKEAGKVRYDNDILKRLIAKIRTVVNKAEDIIDKYVVATRSHYDNKWKRYLDIEHPGRKLELAKDIQMIRSSMERIRKEPAFDLDVLRYEALPNRGPRQIEIPIVEEEYVVGFDGEADAIIERLIGGSEGHEVISIAGMPGLGKTTLANKVFKDEKVKCYFRNRAWVYACGVYKRRDIFLRILKELSKLSKSYPDDMTDEDLANEICKYLGSEKYFIVMDDVWTVEDWHKLKIAFPKNNGSRVLVSTRHNVVAMHANSKGGPYKLKLLRFLSEDESWELLQKKVFQDESCPDELKKAGQIIAKKCDGLPLAIVIIAGSSKGEVFVLWQWPQASLFFFVQMIVAVWNVRGINKPLKKKRLLNFVRQNHVSFFGLLETRVAPIKFDKVIKGLFPSEQVFVDYSVIRSGRIILVWNSNKVECSILDVSPQCIHCLLQCKISNNTFVCSIVYGLYSVVERRDLWSKLISLRSSVSLPWMICGDFNTVKSPDKKIGGVVPTNYFTKDLVNCCTYLDVIDAPSIGNFLTWSNSRVKAKLDRVLIDPLWANGNYSCSVEFKEFDCISDHCPMLIKLFNSCVATNRPFKFFNMWLSHHSFRHILLESWNIYISGTSQYQFVQHLKALKGPLKRLNKEEFGHIAERAVRANTEYSQFATNFDVITATEEDRTKLSDLRKRASFLAEAERQFVSQKLKFKVLIDGDKGSKYFHDLIKRSNRDKSITCILDHHGQPTTSLAQVGAIFVEHFEDLFGSASARTTCNPDFLANGPLFDNSQHDLLCKDVTNQEIKDALFAINDQKAPGPDGYSAAFFKHNWNVIGEDLIEAVREFFVSGQILKQINYTVVALVPKSQNAQRVGDFRPISCCNVLYKVISKILAARLCCVLPKLINKAQAAFIEGRSMSDNIFLAQELIRGYARKRISPRCMLMVDLRKAYDTIDWNFIFEVLSGLNFPTRFINWIMECVTTTSFSISINGGLYGNFKGRRGLRQGDPISPLLFACCIEYLSRTINRLTNVPSFSFHPKCAQTKISHLAFADDLMLFCRGDPPSVKILLNALSHLQETSGLTVNVNKSNIFAAGVRGDTLNFVDFPLGSLPVRYLGIPLDAQRLKSTHFSALIDSVSHHIAAWKRSNLTYAGRLELLSSVIQGTISFWLQNFSIPSNILDQIITICRNFLWGDKPAPIAWETVCHPKDEGGLGLHNLKIWNQAFISKILWDIHSKQDSLWIRWVCGYYIKTTDFWDWMPKVRDSPLMKAVFAVRNALVDRTGSAHLARVFLLTAFKKNKFHIAMVYDLLRHRANEAVKWRFTWRPYIPRKFSFILWLALQNRLRTKDRLILPISEADCSLCVGQLETSNHLFFRCNFSLQVWSMIRNIFGFPKNTLAICSSIKWIRRLFKGTRRHSKAVAIALASTVYHIWSFRNQVIHDSYRPSLDGLVNIIATDTLRVAFSLRY